MEIQSSVSSICYQYDGSFEGLLSVMHVAFKNKTEPEEIITEGCAVQSLFSGYIKVETEINIAERVVHNIERRISKQAVGKIFYSFLSGKTSVGLAVYNYLKEGLKYGRKLDHFQTNIHVKKIHDLYRSVVKEAHLMNGLLRFKVTSDDRYYAEMKTDANVLPIIGKHFQARMKGVPWIIHDVKRNLAAISTDDGFEIREFELICEPEFHTREEEFQNLWKNYFKKISIKERKNKKLQRQFIPKRYEKYLVEKV